jgi:ATP-dependent DNA helicase RecQ
MPAGAWSQSELLDVIARHWGFGQLRPLQEEAMRAVLDGHDSVVVLPTGGGKSLCYQAPAVLRGGTTVVISPLIALMKDQVDGLRACSIAAAQLDSTLSEADRFVHEMELRQGNIRLLFVSPERLVQTDLYRILQKVQAHTFAIDEAHCISHWGHDFRPEYRQLSRLREFFPDAAVHAYTATATEQVRRDIASQLALHDPVTLVGNFDRPNLTYRVLPRHDLQRQVGEVLDRHEGEAGIIYCLRRRDVDELAAALQRKGLRVMPYHAGLSGEQRQATQDAFAEERCDIVVATIAFGMGIDRSNVRFVLHTGLPKSLEHYQQETGRAGRDGLEAECVLLYSGADVITFKAIIEKSAAENAVDPSFLPSAMRHLEEMDRYCRGAVCRHRALVEYFGQEYPAENCSACDLCLGDTTLVPDARTVAQKILSCVARVRENFGINHVVAVLRGDETDAVRKWKHEQLTTYGLLMGQSKPDIRDWIYQLIGQGVLVQSTGEYPVLKLNDASWEVMRGQRDVRLVQLVRRKKGERPQKSKVDVVSWEGVDRELFEALRRLRRELASERAVPPYVIFGDATLRELARVKPTTPDRMRAVYGIGDSKLKDFGPQFLAVISEHVRCSSLPASATAVSTAISPKDVQVSVFDLFRRKTSLEDVTRRLNLRRTEAVNHLIEFLQRERPASLVPWVSTAHQQMILDAARLLRTLNPDTLMRLLGNHVSAEEIRIVAAYADHETRSG